MNAPTDWVTPLGILLSGLIAGFMFVYSSRRSRRTGSEAALMRRDLEERRDVLISRLRELEDDPTAGAAGEKQRLERDAASVLASLDQSLDKSEDALQPDPSPAKLESSGFFRLKPEQKGFLWGVLSVGALAGLGYLVARSSQPRVPDAVSPRPAGSSASGTTATGATGASPDAQLAQLESATRQHPDDVSGRLELTKAYLDRENLTAAFEQTAAVLQREPSNPRALTYQAIVRMAMGQQDVALQMFEKATGTDPSVTEAWIGIAWLQTQAGHDTEAESAIRSAIARNPADRSRLTDLLVQMRARRSAAPAGSRPAGSQQAPSLPGATSQAPAAGPQLRVTIELSAEARRRLSPSAVLFVIARAAGVTSGPPIAVKRLAAGPFPAEVVLSAADSMMGQALPATLRIEARIDSDGNPLTRDPADPSASADNVQAGSAIALTLR